MLQFNATLEIISGNPFVYVPESILQEIFLQAGKSKGPIPIRGAIHEKAYQQTLVKYAGHWRLYINMEMLHHSPNRIGETIDVTIEFDPSDRTIEPHPKLLQALAENEAAKAVFDQLQPSRKKEIVRYISFLKSEASVEKNIRRAINFLLGKERFVGRDKP